MRALLALLAVIMLPAVAHAAEPDVVPELRGDTPHPGPSPLERPHQLGVELGMRLLVVDDAGLDPYAENDVLPQAVVGASYTPLSFGPFAFGLCTEYDVGSTESTARGETTSLLMHRLGGGIHAQVDLWRFQLYARGMAGAIYAYGTLDGGSHELETSGWTWATDVTGGTRFRLGSAGPRERPIMSFWLIAEGGYAFAGDIDMAFAPPEEEGSRQYGTLHLPPLHPAGPIGRAGFALSFL